MNERREQDPAQPGERPGDYAELVEGATDQRVDAECGPECAERAAERRRLCFDGGDGPAARGDYGATTRVSTSGKDIDSPPTLADTEPLIVLPFMTNSYQSSMAVPCMFIVAPADTFSPATVTS